MTRDQIIQAFDRMRVWQRGDRRAVHKPLLVLFALSRIAAGDTGMIDWNLAEPHLKELLEEFARMDRARLATTLSGTSRRTDCGNSMGQRKYSGDRRAPRQP